MVAISQIHNVKEPVPMDDASLSERASFMLAALAPVGTTRLTPVQVQKLFFLLDENLSVTSPRFKKKRFDFQPYDYGPYDREVYTELEDLEAAGYVEIVCDYRKHNGIRTYRLTDEGKKAGDRILGDFASQSIKYINDVVDWIRDKDFAQIVSAIYKEYPEMRKNSVFARFAG